MFMASKGMSKRWQSPEDLWLSEPDNQSKKGGRDLNRVGVGSFNLTWKGKDKGESTGVKTAVGDTLSNIIPCRFYTLKQNLLQSLYGQWETATGWGQGA